MLAFGRFVDVLVVDPAPAVAGDFVAQRLERRRELRVAFKRHGNAEDGQRQLPFLELAQEAPDADT